MIVFTSTANIKRYISNEYHVKIKYNHHSWKFINKKQSLLFKNKLKYNKI